MNSSHKIFKQQEYNHVFYWCDNNHPFIAFTTCYCPMCESNSYIKTLTEDLEEVENDREALNEKYLDIVMKAKTVAPELLI